MQVEVFDHTKQMAAAAAHATKLINAIEQAPQPSENT